MRGETAASDRGANAVRAGVSDARSHSVASAGNESNVCRRAYYLDPQEGQSTRM
jgi:hypothetical protein